METIIETFTNANLFSLIQASMNLTWFSQSDAVTLDLDYFYNHSGEKRISLLVSNLINLDETTYIAKIVSIAILKFKEKWNRIWLALVDSSYNPIENYDSTETLTPTNYTNTRTIKQKTDLTRDTDTNVYGFNSTQEVALNSGSEHTTGLDTNNITTDTNIESGSRTTTRHGNIGVTTNQQMITQEIEMRSKFNLYEIMMQDLDSIIAHPIY